MAAALEAARSRRSDLQQISVERLRTDLLPGSLRPELVRDLLGASDAVHPDLIEVVHALRATAASAIPTAPIGAIAIPLVAKGLGVVGTVVRLGITDGTVQGLASASFLEPWAGGITKVVNHVASRFGVSPERWLLTAFTMAGDEIRELAVSAKDSSFELGLALALMSKATNMPVPYDILATGAVDPEGNVTEVAEEDVEHKLRGAWREHGFTRRVLVPQSQVAAARQLCQANQWALEIVGVKSVAAALKLVWPAHELRCVDTNPDPPESRVSIWRGLCARTRALILSRRKVLLTLGTLVSLLLASFFGRHFQGRSSTSRAAMGPHTEYYSHWGGQRAPLPMRLFPERPARLGLLLDGANRVQAVLVEGGRLPASDDDWVWINYKPLPVVGSQRLDRVHVVRVTSQEEGDHRRILVDIDDDGAPEYRGEFNQGKGEIVGDGPLGQRFDSCSLSRDWIAGTYIDGAITHWLLANIGAFRTREAGGWYRADWHGWLRAVRRVGIEESEVADPESVPFDHDVTSAYAKLTDSELELRFNRWSEPCKLNRRDRIAEGICASPVVPAVAEPAPIAAKIRVAIDDVADPRHIEGEMRLIWPEENILSPDARQHPAGELTFRLCLDFGDGPAPVFRGLLGESPPGSASE
ncbi:MAG: hypothetical protein RDU25_00080 [Patescibacteria group bacterium]|nr:hypothetical protein [Patescibacteria group bacterium]